MTDSPQDLIEEYIGLRDWKEAEEKRFEEDMKRKCLDRMREIECIVLTHLNATGNDHCGAKGRGTAHRMTVVSLRTEDMDAFRRHVIGSADYDIADFKPNKSLVVKQVNEGEDPPPGVKYEPMDVVRFRKG